MQVWLALRLFLETQLMVLNLGSEEEVGFDVIEGRRLGQDLRPHAFLSQTLVTV